MIVPSSLLPSTIEKLEMIQTEREFEPNLWQRRTPLPRQALIE